MHLRLRVVISAMAMAGLPFSSNAQETERATQPAVSAASTQASRMTDEELDAVVAGKAIQSDIGFNTVILNPGKAEVYIEHKNGSYTCINLCVFPPPPPPCPSNFCN